MVSMMMFKSVEERMVRMMISESVEERMVMMKSVTWIIELQSVSR